MNAGAASRGYPHAQRRPSRCAFLFLTNLRICNIIRQYSEIRTKKVVNAD